MRTTYHYRAQLEDPGISNPVPPKVTIRYRTGALVECPVKYLGWEIPEGQSQHFHCWRVLNEGPYDYREGDQTLIEGGSMPQWVETPGTGPRIPPPSLT